MEKCADVQNLCKSIGVKTDNIFDVFDPMCGKVIQTIMITSNGEIISDDCRIDALTSLELVSSGAYGVAESELLVFPSVGTCYAIPNAAFEEISKIIKKYDKMIVKVE